MKRKFLLKCLALSILISVEAGAAGLFINYTETDGLVSDLVKSIAIDSSGNK